MGITAGPDGNLWFTEASAATRSAGSRRPASVTEFRPASPPAASPTGSRPGPDGNLWFTESRRQPDRPDHADGRRHRVHRRHHRRQPVRWRSRPARTATSGSPSSPATGSAGSHRPASSPSSPPASPPAAAPTEITAGPDGNLWFTETAATRSAGSRRAGVVTEFSAGSAPLAALERDHGRPGRQPLVHRVLGNRIGRLILDPAVTTGDTSSIGTTSADLAGTVTPYGSQASYVFEYGPTTAYGSATSAQTLPPGAKPVAVSAQITGLQPGTLYHYHLVTTIVGGTSAGADRTFSTKSPTAAPSTAAPSAPSAPSAAGSEVDSEQAEGQQGARRQVVHGLDYGQERKNRQRRQRARVLHRQARRQVAARVTPLELRERQSGLHLAATEDGPRQAVHRHDLRCLQSHESQPRIGESRLAPPISRSLRATKKAPRHVEVYLDLEADEIELWLIGGWGIDALLGRQTREHHDLDVLVEVVSLERFRQRLHELGFASSTSGTTRPGGGSTRFLVGSDDQPTAFVYAHRDGREIDVHVIRREQDGTVTTLSDFAAPGDSRWTRRLRLGRSAACALPYRKCSRKRTHRLRTPTASGRRPATARCAGIDGPTDPRPLDSTGPPPHHSEARDDTVPAFRVMLPGGVVRGRVRLEQCEEVCWPGWAGARRCSDGDVDG